MSKFSLTLLLLILHIPQPNPINFQIIYIFSSLPFLEGRASTAWELKSAENIPTYNDIIEPNIKPFGSLAVSVPMIVVFSTYEYIDKT